MSALALAVAWGAAGSACGGGASHGQRRKAGPRVFSVHVETVRSRAVSDDVVATGTAMPAREVTLSPQVQGLLVRSKVELGRHVKKGELLARVSTVGLYGESRQASAELTRLRSDIAQAKEDLSATESLFRQKIASRKQRDDARYKLARLRAQLAQAQARLSSVGERYRGGVVLAPFAGVIAEKRADVGDYLSPGKGVGRLVDLSSVKVTVGVAEVDVVRIAPTTRVTVSFPALPGKVFPGRILAIAPTADKQSGAFPVEVAVANPKRVLRGGMAARVVFHRPPIRGVFVPVEAVVRRGGRPVAYVLSGDGGHVRQVVCQVGRSRDGLVEVRAGLRPGDRLVTSGNTRLRKGSAVRVAGMEARRPAARRGASPNP